MVQNVNKINREEVKSEKDYSVIQKQILIRQKLLQNF